MIIEEIIFDSKNNLLIVRINSFNYQINYELYNKLSISVGKEISKEEYLEIKSFSEFNILLFKSLNFLSYRMRTEKEIMDRLLKETNDFNIIGEVITYLKDNNYIDDIVFTKKFYENKSYYNNWSSKKIIYELQNKGISREKFNEIITETYENDYNNAKKLVEKKYKTLKIGNDNYKFKNKVYTYLTNRGFSYDIIKEIIEEYIK